jgi:hypothetical protein
MTLHHSIPHYPVPMTTNNSGSLLSTKRKRSTDGFSAKRKKVIKMEINNNFVPSNVLSDFSLSPLKRKKVVLFEKQKRNRTTFFQNNPFDILPSEVIKYIFSFLDIENFGKTYVVCWLWNKYAEDDLLWLKHYHNIWNNFPERSEYIKINPVGWKMITLSRLSVEYKNFYISKKYIPPDNPQSYKVWGDHLCSEAAKFIEKNDIESARWLFFIAIQEYDSASLVDPECSDLLIHWGDALSDFACICNDKSRELLIKISRDKYELAKSLMPVNNDTKFGSIDISNFGLRNEEYMVIDD